MLTGINPAVNTDSKKIKTVPDRKHKKSLAKNVLPEFQIAAEQKKETHPIKNTAISIYSPKKSLYSILFPLPAFYYLLLTVFSF